MIKQPQPPGFQQHAYKFSFQVPSQEENVWKWLNNTKTFTASQVWPWKVEFYSPDTATIPNGFHEGVLTNHFGPFLSLPGELTKVAAHYRDLQYLYGSYAISHRWVRPCRLEFWAEERQESTHITCALTCYVRPWFRTFWNFSLKIFWSRFPGWARRSVKKQG